MSPRCLLSILLWVVAVSTPAAWGRGAEERPQESDPVQELWRLGATVFERGGVVVEVHANRTQLLDHHLSLLAGFTELTDLSLEETQVGDIGWPTSVRCRSWNGSTSTAAASATLG